MSARNPVKVSAIPPRKVQFGKKRRGKTFDRLGWGAKLAMGLVTRTGGANNGIERLSTTNIHTLHSIMRKNKLRIVENQEKTTRIQIDNIVLKISF